MLNFSILFSLPEQLQGFIRNRQIRNVWKINLKDRCPDFRSSKKINHTDFRFEREIPILRRIVPPNALVRDHADESFLSLLAIKLKGIWLGLTIWAASEASLPMTSPVLHKTNRPTYPEMIRPDDFKKFKADIREQVRKDAVRMDQHKALVDEIGLGTREAPPGTFPDYVIIGKQASELQKACALGSSTSNQLLEFSSQYMQDSHDSLLRRTIAIKLESELKRQLFPDLPITSRQRSHNDEDEFFSAIDLLKSVSGSVHPINTIEGKRMDISTSLALVKKDFIPPKSSNVRLKGSEWDAPKKQLIGRLITELGKVRGSEGDIGFLIARRRQMERGNQKEMRRTHQRVHTEDDFQVEELLSAPEKVRRKDSAHEEILGSEGGFHQTWSNMGMKRRRAATPPWIHYNSKSSAAKGCPKQGTQCILISPPKP
ncbi:hypothetical protein KEM48_003936 [Puccinia striiformis f. sp. tritici PST-130]|nr:hypothetical protein KEM48_003936 [Puccinia striiformis f. sp. tritici PST-130]